MFVTCLLSFFSLFLFFFINLLPLARVISWSYRCKSYIFHTLLSCFGFNTDKIYNRRAAKKAGYNHFSTKEIWEDQRYINQTPLQSLQSFFLLNIILSSYSVTIPWSILSTEIHNVFQVGETRNPKGPNCSNTTNHLGIREVTPC